VAPATICPGVRDCMSLGAFLCVWTASGSGERSLSWRKSLMASRPTPQLKNGRLGNDRSTGDLSNRPVLASECWCRPFDGTSPDLATSSPAHLLVIAVPGVGNGIGGQHQSLSFSGFDRHNRLASPRTQRAYRKRQRIGSGFFDSLTQVMKRQPGRCLLTRPGATPSHDARCAAAGRRTSDCTSLRREGPLVS
jgi:hypothetical protein